MSLFEKVFGTHSDKELKKIYPIVDKIEALDSTCLLYTSDAADEL